MVHVVTRVTDSRTFKLFEVLFPPVSETNKEIGIGSENVGGLRGLLTFNTVRMPKKRVPRRYGEYRNAAIRD